MTFELSPEQESARVRARALAQDRLAAAAVSIDEQGAIPADLLRELQAAVSPARHDATTLVVVVEELALVSAAAAAAAVLGGGASGAADLGGLRGFAAPAASDTRGRLVFAAIAGGIARAAVDAALAVLRETGAGVHEQERPHWVLADAATETEAARMLTLQAAQALAESASADASVAMAKLAATHAAQHAVDAALRIVGTSGFERGSLLERLSRDIRAVSLIMGGEEELRATAAQALLPG